MSIDEFIRVFGYAVLSPGFLYLGLVAKNRGHCSMSFVLYGLSAFFLLLLVGLVLLRYSQPYRPLIYLNTVVVMLLTIMVSRLCFHFLRLQWLERNPITRKQHAL